MMDLYFFSLFKGLRHVGYMDYKLFISAYFCVFGLNASELSVIDTKFTLPTHDLAVLC